MEKESNWRFNVWQMGWGSSLMYLAAPLRGSTLFGIGAWNQGPLRALIELEWAGVDRGWIATGQSAPPPTHPHFPFGFDVDPD